MSGFIQALYNVFQTGKRGLVPAPTDAEVLGQYVLCADARWRPGVGSGTVVSVGISGANGITVAGSPITDAGTIALSVDAPTLKTHLGLNLVENTALSTWAGSANITTLGTIVTGTVPAANVSGLGAVATSNDYNDLDNLPVVGAETANTVLAGPASGPAATPSYRALVAADIPSLSGVYQPLDADLTAIAALTTTSYGRGFLDRANAAAAATYAGVGTGDSPAFTGLSVTGAALKIPSTNTVGIQLYNTIDQTTNYERFAIRYSAGSVLITQTYEGTGTSPRAISIATYSAPLGVGSNRFTLTTTGTRFTLSAPAASDNTIAIAEVTGGPFTATSGTLYGLKITPTYNQTSGTAANTDLLINRTETAVGSGEQLLLSLAVGGTAKLKVSNTGIISVGSGMTVLNDSAGKILSAALNTVAVAQGGTGATDAGTARTNLGLGTMATQAASSVAITGGTINGTAIGGSTPSTGAFTGITCTPTTGDFPNDTLYNFTATSGVRAAVRSTINLTNAAPASTYVIGYRSNALVTANDTMSGAVIGTWDDAVKQGDASMSGQLVGHYSGITVGGAGNVSLSVGTWSFAAFTGAAFSGTVAEHIDFYASTPQRTGTGLVTNLYGVKIDPHGDSWVTNAYGLFIDDVNGATGSNYAIYTKAGLVRFGGAVSAPSLTLTADLPVTEGGTGASTAADARTNLGLGTIATQAASAVAITGGTVNGAVIGGSSPAAGTFTTLAATGVITAGSGPTTLTDAAGKVLSAALNTVAIAQGGTGATTDSGARTNLGLGTMAVQAASSVAVTGGTINGTVIGGGTPAAGTFTTLISTSLVTGNSYLIGSSTGYSNTAARPAYIVPVGTADSGATEVLQIVPEAVATANGDQLYCTQIRSKLTTAGFTGLVVANLYVNGQTVGGGGTLAAAYQLYIAAGPTATDRNGIYQAGSSDKNYFAGVTGLGIAASATTQLCLPASTTAKSSLRITHGAAPSSPVDGDLWTTSTAMYVRINGVTKQVQFV